MALFRRRFGTDAALTIRVDDEEDQQVVRLAGQLLAQDNEWSGSVLDAIVDASSGPVTLDCSELTYADVGGVAGLFGAQRRARALGRGLWLRAPHGQPLEVLKQSRFIDVLTLDRRAPGMRAIGPAGRRT